MDEYPKIKNTQHPFETADAILIVPILVAQKATWRQLEHVFLRLSLRFSPLEVTFCPTQFI